MHTTMLFFFEQIPRDEYRVGEDPGISTLDFFPFPPPPRNINIDNIKT